MHQKCAWWQKETKETKNTKKLKIKQLKVLEISLDQKRK